MSKLSDECRAKATMCDKKATEAKDTQAKRLLQDAAQEWRSMAAEADSREARRVAANIDKRLELSIQQISFIVVALLVHFLP